MQPTSFPKWLLWTAVIPCIVNGFSPSNWTQLVFQKFGGSDELLDVAEVERVVSVITNEQSTRVLAKCDEIECTPECVTLRGVYGSEAWPDSLKLSQSNFEHLCPSLLFMLTQDCAHSNNNVTSPPTQIEVWGYSVLFAALISVSTLSGVIVVLPCHGTRSYGIVLSFLIALATGCLVSNSVFVLLPEAFGVHDNLYLWKASTVVGGLYLFYLMERLLHLGFGCGLCRKKSSDAKQKLLNISGGHSHHRGRSHHHKHADDAQPNDVDLGLLCPKETLAAAMANHDTPVNGSTKKRSEEVPEKLVEDSKRNETGVAPAACIILIGHAFHNLLQGMSVGAAFSANTILGISVSVAIICEELPHGLGDFAILLSSGMKRRKAVLFNFLSGCPCFVGLIIGIKLAEVTHATSWILGAAGGVFLYIGLADMLPEMNAAAEEIENRTLLVFLVQNTGLVFGMYWKPNNNEMSKTPQRLSATASQNAKDAVLNVMRGSLLKWTQKP